MTEPKLRFKEENGVQFPDWEEKTFNDIADYKKGPFGSALKKKIFVPKSNSTVKVYEQQNAISKDWRLERYFVTDEYFQANLKSFSVSGGDIIVSCAGTIGEVYELPNDAEEGIINQALMRVRIKKSVINSMVFKCVFDKMISSEGIKISNGSALKNIPPFADMKKQPVFLPSLPEQKKISSLFTELDTLIQSAEKELEGYRELKHGMLQKMFPKKGEKVPEIRFPEFTGDWNQRKLGDAVQITMGQSPDGSTYSETPSDYILVQGNADLKDGWVTPRMWTTQVTKKADAGDLIMSVRAPAGAMGKTAYDAVIGRGVAAIKGNEFIYQLLVKMDGDGYWKPLSCGSTFESLNSNNIKNANVLIPNTNEQKKIGECFSNLDNLIALQQKELDGYKELKKGLLQQMFC